MALRTKLYTIIGFRVNYEDVYNLFKSKKKLYDGFTKDAIKYILRVKDVEGCTEYENGFNQKYDIIKFKNDDEHCIYICIVHSVFNEKEKLYPSSKNLYNISKQTEEISGTLKLLGLDFMDIGIFYQVCEY